MLTRLTIVTATLLPVACPLVAAESWKQHTIDNSSRGADGVRLLDVNGDQLQDVATAWEEGGIVRAYLNPGPNRVFKQWPAVTVGRVQSGEDAVFFDVNHDGAVDVVSCCEGKTRSIFAHLSPTTPAKFLTPDAWRTEVFPATAGQQQWMFALPLQVDGQRGEDLVVASKGQHGAIGWLQAPQNPGDLSAWKYHRFVSASWIMSLQGIDIDNDGDTDLLASERKGNNARILWLENLNDRGRWQEHLVGAVGRQVMFLDIGDLNGDGKLEIVVPVMPRQLVFLSASDDPRQPWSERTLVYPARYGTGKAARFVDVNLDTRTDIVVTCEHAKQRSGVFWMESKDGDDWIDHDISGPSGAKFDRIEVCDLDKDGDLDVMTCEERDQLGVIWYENPSIDRQAAHQDATLH